MIPDNQCLAPYQLLIKKGDTGKKYAKPTNDHLKRMRETQIRQTVVPPEEVINKTKPEKLKKPKPIKEVIQLNEANSDSSFPEKEESENEKVEKKFEKEIGKIKEIAL